jgi:hypothetical protein
MLLLYWAKQRLLTFPQIPIKLNDFINDLNISKTSELQVAYLLWIIAFIFAKQIDV